MSDEIVKILQKQRQDLVVRVLRKHQEVQTARSFVEQVLCTISELLLVLDEQFQVVQVNQECIKKTGVDLVEGRPLSLEKYFVESEVVEAICSGLLHGELVDFTAQMRGSDESFPVILRGTTMPQGSGFASYMLICTDRSALYDLMDKQQQVQRQLIHAERLSSLGEMAAGIGHELMQPLNVILLLARNCIKALKDPLANQQMLQENLNVITDRVNKASSIINTIRSFGKQVDEEFVWLNLNSIVAHVLEFLEPQMRLRQIRVDFKQPNIPCHVRGVEVRLEQVFFNLFQNAFQAMETVDKPCLHVRITYESCATPESGKIEDYAIVRIKDNGVGIAPESVSRIFDPFFSTRVTSDGMGLGLSIVERIVRSFLGFIQVESELGQGAVFTVAIPRHDCVTEEEEKEYG